MRHQLWVIVSFGLLMAGAIGFLYPAFIEGSNHEGFTEIIVSLFRPDTTQRFALRWVFVFIIAASVYVFVIDRLYRRVPITVIRTDITINFKDPEGKRVEKITNQVIRANRQGVAAYYSSHNPSSETGRIPQADLRHKIYCEGRSIKDDLDLYGNERTGFEIFHMFDPALPYGFFMPFVPIAVLNKVYASVPRRFKKYLVARETRVCWVNEYDVDNPGMSFGSPDYSQRNITWIMNFFESVPKTLKIRRIQHTGVLEIVPHIDLETKIVTFSVHNLKKERILITWKPNLEPNSVDGYRT